MTVSEKVKREMLELGTHPHVLDLARRVHPTWVTAHGAAADRGVEQLAREIGQCIAALHHLQEQGENTDQRYVAGHGIVVTAAMSGADTYNVAVIAAFASESRIAMGIR